MLIKQKRPARMYMRKHQPAACKAHWQRAAVPAVEIRQFFSLISLNASFSEIRGSVIYHSINRERGEGKGTCSLQGAKAERCSPTQFTFKILDLLHVNLQLLLQLLLILFQLLQHFFKILENGRRSGFKDKRKKNKHKSSEVSLRLESLAARSSRAALCISNTRHECFDRGKLCC